MDFDLNDLTIEEIETVEDITGQPFDALDDKTVRKGKLMRALVYVAMRRTNPDFTLEDAGKVSIGVLGDAAPKGTPKAASNASRPSRNSRKQQG